MKKETIREKAERFFDNSFNSLSFELLKKAVGEDAVIDYIERPSDAAIREEMDEDELKDKDEDEISEAIAEFYLESEHYPMWSTIFEAKNEFLSEKILGDVDGLYELGIGVIAPTDDTLACLFIAGCGYDFYDAHWIPLFKHWGWITEEDEKAEKTKEEAGKTKLIDWGEFGEILERLAENRDETIKRHAIGLLKELKL